jgi:hypothetical protein
MSAVKSLHNLLSLGSLQVRAQVFSMPAEHAAGVAVLAS